MPRTLDVIDDLDALDAIEADWRRLHARDAQATVFGSWGWLRGRLESVPEPWWLLIARDAEGTIDGMVAVRVRPAEEDERGPVLTLALSPHADYVGVLCETDHEDHVLDAFATHIRTELDWRTFELRDVLDARLDRFVARFPAPAFSIERREPTPCPYLDLTPYLDAEDRWEAYLRALRKARLRREIRHDLRAIERLPHLRRTTVDDDVELQIDTLLRLWRARWGALPEHELEEFRSIFRRCAAEGTLWLSFLWDGEIPISGLAGFIDRRRDAFGFYMTGFNPDYGSLSPGLVIITSSIRAALEMGLHTFDFLRGDEPYKFALGAALGAADNIMIHRM
ncbi:MAG: GNAT family N-acetyltransferase [Acidobacteriota bacterium]